MTSAAPSPFLRRLLERAAAAPKRILFPESHDPRVRRAAARLARDRLAHPVLLGKTSLLESAELAGSTGIEIDEGPTPECRDRLQEHLLARGGGRLTAEQASQRVDDPLARACAAVGLGWADGAVAGAVHTTGDVIRAALRGVGLAPGAETLSSAFYMDVPPFRSEAREVLTFTDAGVVPTPTPAQLCQIAGAAAEARTRIVGDTPRVAFLSYSTLGSASGPDPDKMSEATRLFRARYPDLRGSGELQGDAALIPAVAARKAAAEPVAGTANVLVFPDLNAANISYKLVERLAGATALGPILQGLARPVNDLSRGASVDDIVHVACVTAVLAETSPPDGLPVPDA